MRYAVFDMRRFGMTLTENEAEYAIKKQTMVYTNSVAIDELLSKRCGGGHKHQHLMKGPAKSASLYPEKLMDAFIDGLAMEVEHGKVEFLLNLAEMIDVDEDEEIRNSLRGVDDNSGEEIEPKLIQAARMEEMDGFAKHKVYRHVLREKAKQMNGKFIGVRWVDINKGTRENPNIRCRLVGQAFVGKDKPNDLYAPTPLFYHQRGGFYRDAQVEDEEEREDIGSC